MMAAQTPRVTRVLAVARGETWTAADQGRLSSTNGGDAAPQRSPHETSAGALLSLPGNSA